VVLLDAGGLTDNRREIEKRLGTEDEYESPHVRLGLEMTLRDRPDIAQRFDERWRAAVNTRSVEITGRETSRVEQVAAGAEIIASEVRASEPVLPRDSGRAESQGPITTSPRTKTLAIRRELWTVTATDMLAYRGSES